MLKSPFFSLMIDESTDQSLEQHLIVYATYLTLEGNGILVSKFMKIMNVSDGRGKAIYDVIKRIPELLCVEKRVP